MGAKAAAREVSAGKLPAGRLVGETLSRLLWQAGVVL